MPKILLTGVSGQVGFELASSLAVFGELCTLGRADVDFSQPEALKARVLALKPDIIVNPAAYTAVDKAETEVELAFRLNAEVPQALAEAALQLDALLVHYSTDYVFDGTQAGRYQEQDAVNPMSVYGRSKAEGEQRIRAVQAKHLIFRTSWVFGAWGNNFAKTMLRLAKEREQLNIVADQFGAPTSARLIADITAQILGQYLTAKTDFAFGTYHLTASGETSWHQYAQEVVAFALAKGLSLKAKPDQILPIPTNAYPLPAPRPANSRLNTERLQQQFGLVLPDWRQGLHQVLQLIAKD